jgi:hypothetical protein
MGKLNVAVARDGYTPGAAALSERGSVTRRTFNFSGAAIVPAAHRAAVRKQQKKLIFKTI